MKENNEIISVKVEQGKDKEINRHGDIKNKNEVILENENRKIKEYDFNSNYKESKYKKYIYGFQNNKNNCYLNSSLQLLTRVKGLREGIFDFDKKGNINKNCVTKGNLFEEFKNILEDIEKNEKIIIPDDLKKEMGRIDERYNHSRQEDANEFISNFLDALREETSVKGIKNNHINLYNFSNEVEMEAYKKFCKKCNKLLSVKFNAFNMIELPIYELAKKSRYSLNLDDILKSFFSESKIYESKCDKCHEEVYSQTSIYKLPENLIIFFGRTANEQYINNKINYTPTLDLDEFLHPNSNSNNYDLDCVIDHIGSSECGHYTAICKIADKIWYYFSDSFYHENYSNFYSDNAIILLYKAK